MRQTHRAKVGETVYAGRPAEKREHRICPACGPAATVDADGKSLLMTRDGRYIQCPVCRGTQAEARETIYCEPVLARVVTRQRMIIETEGKATKRTTRYLVSPVDGGGSNFLAVFIAATREEAEQMSADPEYRHVTYTPRLRPAVDRGEASPVT